MTDNELVKAGNYLFAINKEINPNRMDSMLDLQMTSCDLETQTAEFSFVPEDWCLNPYDQVHGGITCSVFDYAGGAGASVVTGAMVSTIDLMVTYLRPMYGSKYSLILHYTHLGKRTVNCTGQLIDADSGKICATCMSSYMLTNIRKGEFLEKINDKFG